MEEPDVQENNRFTDADRRELITQGVNITTMTKSMIDMRTAVDRDIQDHESRLRDLEKDRVNREDFDGLQKAVGSLKTTIAMWMGGITVGGLALHFIGEVIIKKATLP